MKKMVYIFLGVIGLIATYLTFINTTSLAKDLEPSSESKNMKIHNSELIDNNLKFLILDTIILELFDGYTWQGQDINDPNAKGSIFYAYDNPPSRSVASILAVDVTEDTSEQDISLMNPEDVDFFDNRLRADVESGMNLKEWMSSQLNVNQNNKVLVTAYITAESEKEWQYIAIRFSKNGRKIVIIGSFDISMKDALASPVFKTISNTSFKFNNVNDQ